MDPKIKVGICTWCIPLNGSPIMQIAAELGFSGVVADLGFSKENYPLSQSAIQKQLLHDRDRYEMSIPTLAINQLCQTGMSQPQNFSVIKHILDIAVDTAVVLEARLLQLPSFGKGFIQSEAGFVSTSNCLKYACQVAGEKGLMVGTENALTAQDNLLLLEVVAEPNLRIYFDTANPLFLAGGMYAPQMLLEMRENICEVHVKDVSRDTETGAFHFVPLGSGETDFFKSIRILQESDYRGWIHLENELSTELLQKDYEKLRELFSC